MAETPRSRWTRWLREPLVQFLLIGAGLFAAYRVLHRGGPSDPHRIVITSEFVDGLRQDFQHRNGRSPDAAELHGLVARFVDEEVLYREALALGLDRGDVIVRRRLVEKMQFLTEDTAALGEPSDEEMNAWLQAHRSEFRDPNRVSFRHVFFDAHRRPQAAADAAETLSRLKGGASPGGIGDPFVSGTEWVLRTESEVTASFGTAFAHDLFALPASETGWTGPLASPYGLHLVQVTGRSAAHDLPLHDVRVRVREAMLSERRKAADSKAMAAARARYQIDLPPLPPAPAGSPAEARR